MDPENKAWLEGGSGSCPGRDDIERPWRLILLGAPGVGKGTQARLLNRRVGACHLSTGDVFRAAGSRPACDQTLAMRAAIDHIRRGELVPDAIVWEMVRERSQCLRCRGGFILDGFPRTVAQAELLKELMESEELELNAVVSYEATTEEILLRLSGRRTCQQCTAVFHMAVQPPQSEGICDHCGGALYQREDDRPESITVRLEAYERSTAPLIDFYVGLGLLRRVAASGFPDEIHARTMEALV